MRVDRLYFNVYLKSIGIYNNVCPLFQVLALDIDCGVNAVIRYSLIAETPRSEKFIVGRDTGEVCVKEPLDRETTAYHELQIRSTDKGLIEFEYLSAFPSIYTYLREAIHYCPIVFCARDSRKLC